MSAKVHPVPEGFGARIGPGELADLHQRADAEPQDLWLEQVVKRGWVEWEIPGALRPDLTAVWLVIVALAAVFGAVLTSRPFRLPS